MAVAAAASWPPACSSRSCRLFRTASSPSDLLVGFETSDDAAVYRLNDEQAIVATTDFFMPIVDDPYEFGRIAATNALSDVYAMGGTPIFGLAILGMPVDRVGTETIRRITRGRRRGLPGGGGSRWRVGIRSTPSSRSTGWSRWALVHPGRILRNSAARAGDHLILTKALGTGICGAALRQDRLGPDAYDAFIGSATQLNAIGRDLFGIAGLHAVTDVTGFGLLGHTLEMARGSVLHADILFDTPAAAAPA